MANARPAIKRERFRGLKKFLSDFKREKLGIAGTILLAILVILSLAEPLYVPFDPNARVHAPLSAPIWMKYFDKYYFPDQVFSDAHFESQEEFQQLIVPQIMPQKIFLRIEKGTNFEVNYGWASGEGSPKSGKGSLYIEIVDRNTTPLDSSHPYVKVTIGTMFKWSFQRPPHDLEARFYIRGLPTYLLDSLASHGYKGDVVQAYFNIYLENMSREMLAPELYNYLQSQGVIGLALGQDITDDGVALFKGGSPILTTWNERTPLLRPDVLVALFKPGFTLVFKIVIKFQVLDEAYRLARAGVRYYLDDIFLKAYSHYYGIMGTDGYGRDLFAMIFDGLKISLLVGIIATLGSIFIGGSVGIVSGYFGGKIDEILMRIVDFLMVMPGLPLLIVLAYVFTSMGVSAFWAIIFVLTIFGWAGMARVIRSQVLSIKSAIYVEAAKAVGASDLWVMRKHILTSVWPLMMMYLMTGVVGNILSEAGLTFLGVLTPKWNSIGKILNEASVGSIREPAGGVSPGAFGGIAWWWVFFPGLILMLLGMAFYMIAEALTRIYSPRLRGY
ncbi:MAG: ABC transporter permease [Candidatus Njordarchaeales archaeon]